MVYINPDIDFGPQSPYVKELLETALTLPSEEVGQLYPYSGHGYGPVWGSAYKAAIATGRMSARNEIWRLTSTISEEVVRLAAWDALSALLVRDVLRGTAPVKGQSDRQRFDREYYDLLTYTWRASIGPIHDDDSRMSRRK